MTKEELATKLCKRYEGAKINEAAMQVHLFGIEYGNEIKKENIKISDIIELAGIGKGYAAELSKGVKLSNRVTLKEEDN